MEHRLADYAAVDDWSVVVRAVTVVVNASSGIERTPDASIVTVPAVVTETCGNVRTAR